MTAPSIRTSSRILSQFGRPLRVLEAGGGSSKYYSFPEGSIFIVIDISPEQLAANKYAEELILSDLHSYDFTKTKYDVVVFHNVLEHLADPGLVIKRAINGLPKGGAIIIGGPIISSVQGLITKYTPHWFHVFVYKRVFMHPTAGQPGSPPFPAYSHWLVDPGRLREYLTKENMKIIHYEEFESSQVDLLRKRSKLLFGLYRAAAVILNAVSFGRVRSNATDFQLLAIKQSD
jgi:SAM-dependent methyltransferase